MISKDLNPNKLIKKSRLQPQTGTAFELLEGQFLRVIDPQGEQVSDLVCFGKVERGEWLSSGRTFDYADTIFITKGHRLYSNRSNVMLSMIEDTVGRHDFLLTPCSPETFEIIYKYDNSIKRHPSCFENLFTSLAQYGIQPDEIPTTFNIFMNVQLNVDGSFGVKPPLSKAGDYVVFRAHQDLIVGLTACSAELSNNHSFKPIEFEIYDK
jgi:uncharacterized protein YcgI (DUF1989 family)